MIETQFTYKHFYESREKFDSGSISLVFLTWLPLKY